MFRNVAKLTQVVVHVHISQVYNFKTTKLSCRVNKSSTKLRDELWLGSCVCKMQITLQPHGLQNV